MRKFIDLVERFEHAFIPSYRSGKECTVFRNPTPKEWREAMGKNDEVRAFIVGDDLLVWDVYSSLHQTVRDEMHLDNSAIPLTLSGELKRSEAYVTVTDASKSTPWWHNPKVVGAINANPYLRSNFTDIEVSYYDETIEGDWADLDHEDDDHDEDPD